MFQGAGNKDGMPMQQALLESQLHPMSTVKGDTKCIYRRQGKFILQNSRVPAWESNSLKYHKERIQEQSQGLPLYWAGTDILPGGWTLVQRFTNLGFPNPGP